MAHTTESIRALLATSDAAVERGLVVIYDRQTADEKRAGGTSRLNGIGFSGAHGRRGSYLATWVRKQLGYGKQYGQCLSGRFKGQGRDLIMHYAGQLAAIANEKEASKVVVEQQHEDDDDLAMVGVGDGGEWVGN